MDIHPCQAAAIYQKENVIESWLHRQRTAQLTRHEQQTIKQMSAGCFGYFSLQLGISEKIDTLQSFPIHQKLYLATSFPPREPELNRSDQQSLLYCDPQFLPLADESCDLLVIHHLHELVENPHQFIREAARVVRHEGYILIVGSSLNIKQMIGRTFSGRAEQWQTRLMSRYRLRDWLKLVGFSESHTSVNAVWIDKIAAKLPRLSKALRSLLHVLPISSFYCIKAQKHTTAPIVRPLGADRQKLPSMLGNMAEPSASIQNKQL